MGRKLSFSKENALQQAMQNFWHQGYHRTSMRQLAKQLDIHLGSIYNAFGDKDHIFEMAAGIYFDKFTAPRLKTLVEDPDPLEALDRYTKKILDEAISPDPSPGCFVINSLMDIGSINNKVSAAAHKITQSIEDAFAKTILRAQERGQLSPECDSRKWARFIQGVLFSICVMTKIKMPPDNIRAMQNCAMQALRQA